jgi:hypothetical protein
MSADDSRELSGRRFDVADHLNHPAVVRAFLWNAVATGNPEIIQRAEAAIARAEARRANSQTPDWPIRPASMPRAIRCAA